MDFFKDYLAESFFAKYGAGHSKEKDEALSLLFAFLEYKASFAEACEFWRKHKEYLICPVNLIPDEKYALQNQIKYFLKYILPNVLGSIFSNKNIDLQDLKRFYVYEILDHDYFFYHPKDREVIYSNKTKYIIRIESLAIIREMNVNHQFEFITKYKNSDTTILNILTTTNHKPGSLFAHKKNIIDIYKRILQNNEITGYHKIINKLHALCDFTEDEIIELRESIANSIYTFSVKYERKGIKKNEHAYVFKNLY